MRESQPILAFEEVGIPGENLPVIPFLADPCAQNRISAPNRIWRGSP
jgi:hypothetical protein